MDVHGTPQTAANHPAIPGEVILRLYNLRFAEGMTLEDAVTVIRSDLVPEGYEPYPFCKNTPESLLDKLRSIVATYMYRHTIKELQLEELILLTIFMCLKSTHTLVKSAMIVVTTITFIKG